MATLSFENAAILPLATLTVVQPQVVIGSFVE